jgi:hypothetical protein
MINKPAIPIITTVNELYGLDVILALIDYKLNLSVESFIYPYYTFIFISFIS